MKGSTRIALIGQFVATFLIVWAAFQFVFGIGFGALWFALIGWVLLTVAKASKSKAPDTKIRSPLCVGEVMRRDCDTVSGDIDLQAFVNRYLLKNRDRCYFVAENNRLAGLVSTEQVRRIPCAQWSTKTISQVMSTLDDIQIVAPQMPVDKAYATMMKAEVNHLPVGCNDQLAGIITRDDILADVYTHVTIQN